MEQSGALQPRRPTTAMTDTGTGDPSRLLTPYVPRLVIDWLHSEPETRYRSIDGTGVFADI